MKRLKYIYPRFCWIPVLLVSCCVWLYANETVSTAVKDKLDAVLNNPSRFDYDLYYEVEAEKKAVEIQTGVDLQTLITGLIAYTEGQYENAVESLTAAAKSDDIKRLVNTQVGGGIDGLIKACQNRSGSAYDAEAVEECMDCDGSGIRLCAACRGLGKKEDRTTQRQSVCTDCGGLGGKPCNHCRGYGISELIPLKPVGDNAAIEELIVKAVYLKNSMAQ